MDKYFQEIGHYDRRFFPGEVEPAEKQRRLLAMLKAFVAALAPTGIRPILMHGGLIGWAWNGKLLPWDQDLDVCVFLDELGTLRDAGDALTYDRTRYLLDINPHFVRRETLNVSHRDNREPNKIDARFIDLASGLYIDITALDEQRPGELATKCPHRYRKDDILPLRDARLGGVAIAVPSDVRAVLTQEYGPGVLDQRVYRSYRFDPVRREWRDRVTVRWLLRARARAGRLGRTALRLVGASGSAR